MTAKYISVNEGGHSIRCKIYFNGDIRDQKKLILFGHGFGGHKDNKAAEKMATYVLSKYKKIVIMTFDWPSHGDDVKKRIQLQDCDTYLTLVLNYIREQMGIQEIYGHAISFGAYLYLKYITDHGNPFVKITLRAPAIARYESLTRSIMANDDMDTLHKGKDVLVGFDHKIRLNQQFLDELQASDIRQNDYLDYADDIMVIHGTKDEIASIRESEQFCEDNVIEFLPIEGADHRFQNPLKMDQVIIRTAEFFDL